MTLTPEQFNKLVTRDDFNDLKDEFQEIKRDMKQVLSVVEGLATSFQKFDQELTANVGAHDRIQEDVKKLDLLVTKLEAVTN